MNALNELLEQAMKNRKNKIAVISTEFVIKKIREHTQEASCKSVEGAV